jgi:hypothetical protein
VLLLGGIQLIFLGIIGEYLGRIYDEVRGRPLYIAREILDESSCDVRCRPRAGGGDAPGPRAPDQPD